MREGPAHCGQHHPSAGGFGYIRKLAGKNSGGVHLNPSTWLAETGQPGLQDSQDYTWGNPVLKTKKGLGAEGGKEGKERGRKGRGRKRKRKKAEHEPANKPISSHGFYFSSCLTSLSDCDRT